MKNIFLNFKREEQIKKVVRILTTIVILITIIVLGIMYFINQRFRKWVDISVLQKNITTKDITTIDLDANKNNQAYCYNKYVCILNEKNLKLYTQSGLNIKDISININTALFNSCDKYLAVAESNGQEFCVIYDKEILFNEKIERRNIKYLY